MTEPTAGAVTVDPLRRRIAAVLRAGLVASAVLLVAALLLFLARHPDESFVDVVQNNPIRGYLSLPGFASGVEGGHSQAFLTLAVLVLVATPIARVAAGAYYLRRSGDRPLARIAAAVFVLLLIGILVLGPLLS